MRLARQVQWQDIADEVVREIKHRGEPLMMVIYVIGKRSYIFAPAEIHGLAEMYKYSYAFDHNEAFDVADIVGKLNCNFHRMLDNIYIVKGTELELFRTLALGFTEQMNHELSAMEQQISKKAAA